VREMIPAVGGALGELGLMLSSGSESLVSSESRGENGIKENGSRKGKEKKPESRSGYWDDVCLARFLEGVCWRFVAYPVCGPALGDSLSMLTHVPLRIRMLSSNLMKRSLSHRRTRGRTRSVRSALSLSTDLISSWTIISCIMHVSWFYSVVDWEFADFFLVDFEYGRLLARSGDKDGARTQFDLVMSGKPLEVNAAGRKVR